jgi:hypothetical protein
MLEAVLMGCDSLSEVVATARLERTRAHSVSGVATQVYLLACALWLQAVLVPDCQLMMRRDWLPASSEQGRAGPGCCGSGMKVVPEGMAALQPVFVDGCTKLTEDGCNQQLCQRVQALDAEEQHNAIARQHDDISLNVDGCHSLMSWLPESNFGDLASWCQRMPASCGTWQRINGTAHQAASQSKWNYATDDYQTLICGL